MKDSAVLFIDSPGRKGLVASVSGLLYEPGVTSAPATTATTNWAGSSCAWRTRWGPAARGRDLERMVLARAVRWRFDRRILCYGNKAVGFD